MPLFVANGGRWRESPRGFAFAPKRFPGNQGSDFIFEGRRYKSFFDDANTAAPPDMNSGDGAYDKDWVIGVHNFTFKEGAPLRIQWFIGSITPTAWQYSTSGTIMVRIWVGRPGVRQFNTFSSRNDGGPVTSLDGMQRLYISNHSQIIPRGQGRYDFRTTQTYNSARIRELIPDVREGDHLQLFFTVQIRRFGSRAAVQVRGQNVRVYELSESNHRFSKFKQIYVANGGQWRPLWIKLPWQYQQTGNWGMIAGRNAAPRWPDPNNDRDWIPFWGSAIMFMVDWNSGDPADRARPITGIRLRIKTRGGQNHGMEIRIGSYQDFERRGVVFQHQGYGKDRATKTQHDRVNTSIASQWGNYGIHPVQWPRNTTQESPWLDCYVPVGEALTIIFQSHFGSDQGDANELSGIEIIDVRYG